MPESRPHEEVVQDDYAKADPLTDTHRGLVVFSGPGRCTLSHPDNPSSHPILEIRLRGSGLFSTRSFPLHCLWPPTLLCEGKPAFGHWSKAEKGFPVNCLEMVTVCRACQFFLPDLIGQYVLIHLDNMSVVSYINHQGGLSLKHLFILVEYLLEWAQLNLRSLRAAHLPVKLTQGADMLSRSNVPSEEWMFHPQTVQVIWKIFGRAEVDLFAFKDSSHCPTYNLKVRDALAHDWPNLLLYAFPPIVLIPKVVRWIREQGRKVLLVAPLLENQPWLSELTQLLVAAPWPVPLRRDLLSQANGTIWHPRPELFT